MADQGESGSDSDDVVEEPSDIVEPDLAGSLGKVATEERSKSRQRWLIEVAAIVVSTGLAIVVLFAIFGPGLVVIGPVVAGLVGIASIGGPPRRRETTTQTSTSGTGPRVGTEVQLTNIAFSDEEPTWRGWSKDVGVLSVSPERLVIVGRKRQLAIDAPFIAELHDHKHFFWMMVKVTGSASSGQPPTMYLVVRGAPKTKFAANPDEMAEESSYLVAEINSVSPT